MKITLTKENWDEVTKLLYGFFVPEDNMIITEDYEHVSPFIAVPFNDPLNHRFLILGCGSCPAKIELTEGTEIDLDEDCINLTEENIEIFKKPLSPRLLKERDTRITTQLRGLIHQQKLSKKAEALNTILGEKLFDVVEEPDDYDIMGACITVAIGDLLKDTGLSLKDGVKITVAVNIRYPKSSSRNESVQFPLRFDISLTEDRSGMFSHHTMKTTQDYTELVTMIAGYIS